ncbi:hypothetical protein HGRIS_010581 [Hohenbuehelia grisea]|uniref:Uncharacterized protein n=1 Tax=Hohenbuehelia grisea TaxID=104357 RepID=A0ABR3IX89_9AGAR
MSAGLPAGNQQPQPQQAATASTWTEPPWSGWIETTGDALLILEAARRGLIPRVTRRLVDSERKMITSGSVFVFDEDESGIKRWTDGFFWSPSRILGNFLLYRETDKRGSGHRSGRGGGAVSDDVNEAQYSVDGTRMDGQSLSRPKSDSGGQGMDRHRERTLVGSLTNSYKFKPDGLMKKTFSLSIGGVAQHLISYYKVEDVENGRLRSPSSLPELASLDISPEYLDKTHFRNPPKVEIGIDGLPRYRGEADDIETSPTLLAAPISASLPLLTDGRVTEASSSKRAKRYEPYASPSSSSAPKKPRHRKNAEDDSPIEPSPPPALEHSSPQSIPQAGPHFPDPNLAVAPPPHPPYPYPPPNYYPTPAGYPMAAPPPMYPPPAGYPPTGAPGPPPAPQYVYPAPAVPPPGPPPVSVDGTQPPHQQGYYPFYPPSPHAPPPPPHAYPAYPGVPWPPYSGYPPPPMAHHHQPPAILSAEGQGKLGEGEGA